MYILDCRWRQVFSYLSVHLIMIKKSFRFFLTKLDVVRNGEELEEVSLASKDMEL